MAARNSVSALKRAIEVMDGQSALARELTARTGASIRQGHIWAWLHRSKRVPPELAVYIAQMCAERGRPISLHELCPDFPWDVALAVGQRTAAAAATA